jgi:hypothetical protein
MSSAKQIAANRANSKRSTGPKTNAGILKSSRNAFRHGLSGPLQIDAATLAKIQSIAWVLIDEPGSEEQLVAASLVAEIHLELLRVRRVRNEFMESLNEQPCSLQQLKRILALDRYERCAIGKRRQARQRLQMPAHGGNKKNSVG